jgi:GNAT superfamily N-acetyltransferase
MPARPEHSAVLVVRAPVPADLDAIAALGREPGDGVLPDVDASSNFRRSLVACSEGTVVAYGSIFSRPLHPARLRLDVFVSPDSRNHGIGRALVHQLVAKIPKTDMRDLQANYWQSDRSSAGFWDRLGFEHLMRTRIGTFDPWSLAEEPIQRVPEGVSIGIGAELMSDRRMWDDIALLHETVYRRNHSWNPPAPIDLLQARDLFLHPADLIPDALFVALEFAGPEAPPHVAASAVASAVASLRASSRAGRCELGWIGARDPEVTIATPIVNRLLQECFARARNRGWLIDIEADDADPILGPLADTLDLIDRKIFLAVTKARPA